MMKALYLFALLAELGYVAAVPATTVVSASLVSPVPDNNGEQECLHETICVEFDVPMTPVWDNETQTCSCQPRSDDELICIAATTCLPGSSPYWNPETKKCSCVASLSKRDVSSATPTTTPAPTPAPTVDSCTLLKIYCECGDHYMHWSEENQACQCPPCGPVVSLECENLLIYCNEGDHKMHWDAVSGKCQCLPPM